MHSLIDSTPVLHVAFNPPPSEDGEPTFPVILPMLGCTAPVPSSSLTSSLGDEEATEGEEELKADDVKEEQNHCIYLHGYVSSRLMKLPETTGSETAGEEEAKGEGKGVPVTVSATSLDGIVLALTPFAHSCNYRSAVVFGVSLPVSIPVLLSLAPRSGLFVILSCGDWMLGFARPGESVYAHRPPIAPWNQALLRAFSIRIADLADTKQHAQTVTTTPEKLQAMALITNNLIPHRWSNTRIPPTPSELTSTGILRVTIHSASAKVHVGGPGDERKDVRDEGVRGRVWAGVVPTWLQYGPCLEGNYNGVGSVPGYLREWVEREGRERRALAYEALRDEKDVLGVRDVGKGGGGEGLLGWFGL